MRNLKELNLLKTRFLAEYDPAYAGLEITRRDLTTQSLRRHDIIAGFEQFCNGVKRCFVELIIQGIVKAFELIVTFDPEVLGITWLSLKISGTATFISLFIGVSIGTAVALNNFFGKRFVISLINTGMGLPPVVVGLFVTMMIWRSGPFGFLEILYTPYAMIIAQAIIATPIVMGISLAAIQNLSPNLRLQILSLGASRLQMVWVLIKEARLPLLAAVMAGFGGVISEVGASIMVGGNIKGYSRVLTTATVMETGKGNFDVAIALGIILLLLSFIVNYLLTQIQQRQRSR
jgi:tungstate transport system permease protein